MKKESIMTSTSATAKVQLVTIDEDMAGQRIDNFLIAKLKGAPKSLIYRVLRKGEVRINKGRVKPDYKLRAGDLVRIPPVRLAERKHHAQPSQGLAKELSQSILYEDNELLIINKPSGLAVHGGSGVSLGLIESLRAMKVNERFLELVHRLDRDTSGCVMLAKSRRSLRYIQQQLKEGHINKCYWALVGGRWPNRRQQVDMPLLKNQLASGERVVRAVEEGTEGAKRSLTLFRVLERYPKCTLVEAKPITGRTHQIRVHSQYAGNPILGDEKYGNRPLDQEFRSVGLKRLFLHAFSLDFTSVDGRDIHVEAPLEESLRLVLNHLDGSGSSDSSRD